ncbi:MAG: hypothetical protein ACD_7C00422G0001 [uncultured bacterium]|nr:MAG: hypothetical protein ACD_7C00422G0001 [uncultured bacterium]
MGKRSRFKSMDYYNDKNYMMSKIKMTPNNLF